MFHPRLSISSLSSYRWSFEQDLALWRELGACWAGTMFDKLDGSLARMTEAGIGISTGIGSGFNLRAPESWNATPTGPGSAPPGGRVPFGEGDLPLEQMFRDVIDTGYDGPYELEMPGPQGEAEGYAPLIRRGAEKATALLQSLGL